MEPRTPLARVSHNRQPRQQLSPGTKREVIGARRHGISVLEIARVQQLPTSTVKSTIRKVNQRGTTDVAPRSGHPKQITTREERYILRVIRRNCHITYDELRRETGLDFASSTFWRLLRRYDISHWRSKRRPELTEGHARIRLQFARQYSHLTAADWRNRFIFSDECLVEKGRGKKRPWSFGYASEKWTPNKVDTYPKGKQLTIMVWGAIGHEFKTSDLIIMSRDQSASHRGYSAVSYIETLTEGLLPVYNGQTFQQDNAPIHNAAVTQNWLAEQGILALTGWPPYSPDLNPIEHIWPRLKELVYEVNPALDHVQGREQQRQAMVEALREAWNRIPDHVVDACIESMPRRLQAVIDAEGWQTKY